MPDFRDNFTAREVCEGMLGQINVYFSPAIQQNRTLKMFWAGRKDRRSSTTRRPSRWSRSRREKLSVSVSQDNRPGQQAPVSEPAGREVTKLKWMEWCMAGIADNSSAQASLNRAHQLHWNREPESNLEKAPTVPVSQQAAEPTPQAEAMKLPVEAPRRSERVRKQPAWMKDYSTCN